MTDVFSGCCPRHDICKNGARPEGAIGGISAGFRVRNSHTFLKTVCLSEKKNLDRTILVGGPYVAIIKSLHFDRFVYIIDDILVS